MKKTFLLGVLSVFSLSCFAQKWGTRAGQVEFFSKTPVEDIDARNKAVSAVVDVATGAVAVSLNIRDFRFKRALMEEHFNENYLESDTYPKADFRGVLENPSAIDWTKDGVYTARVEGNMTIHGVTQKVAVPMQILLRNGKAGVAGSFPIRLEDYRIKVPKLVITQIAETIDVTVLIAMQPL